MIKYLAGLFLVSLAAAASGADDPQAAALKFLNKLKEQDIRPTEETAISNGITPEKLKSIIRKLDRIGSDLHGHDLRVVSHKTDGDLAGVVVAQMSIFDPSRIRLHAVGLIQREGKWVPAPVPASFENTGVSYMPELSEKAREMERWMLAERTKRMDGIREELGQLMQQKIADALDKEKLKNADPSDVVNDFMAAWKNRNYHAVLGYLGGMQDPLPEDWSETVSMVATELERERGKLPDETPLGSNEVISTTVHTEKQGDVTIVSIGAFLLNKPGRSEDEMMIRHFKLTKGPDGTWRIRLPTWLTGQGKDTFKVTASDKELLDRLPMRLFESRKMDKFDDIEKLSREYLSDLTNEDFGKLLGYVAVDSDENAKDALDSHARLWRIARRTPLIRLLVETHVEGDEACALYYELDPHKPELRPDLIRPLRIVRNDENGWRVHRDATPEVEDFSEEMAKWIEQNRKRDLEEWLPEFGLEERLGGIPADSAPDEKTIKEFAESWREALESRQPNRIFEHATIFDDEDGIQLLFKYLGQELPSHSKLEILGTHRKGRWGAVSIRHYSPVEGEKPIDLLHPIVDTPSGPKCLPEAVLYVSNSRTREILNSVVWRRLGKRLPEAATEELKAIHEEHNTLSGKSQDAE